MYGVLKGLYGTLTTFSRSMPAYYELITMGYSEAFTGTEDACDAWITNTLNN